MKIASSLTSESLWRMIEWLSFDPLWFVSSVMSCQVQWQHCLWGRRPWNQSWLLFGNLTLDKNHHICFQIYMYNAYITELLEFVWPLLKIRSTFWVANLNGALFIQSVLAQDSIVKCFCLAFVCFICQDAKLLPETSHPWQRWLDWQVEGGDSWSCWQGTCQDIIHHRLSEVAQWILQHWCQEFNKCQQCNLD